MHSDNVMILLSKTAVCMPIRLRVRSCFSTAGYIMNAKIRKTACSLLKSIGRWQVSKQQWKLKGTRNFSTESCQEDAYISICSDVKISRIWNSFERVQTASFIIILVDVNGQLEITITCVYDCILQMARVYVLFNCLFNLSKCRASGKQLL